MIRPEVRSRVFMRVVSEIDDPEFKDKQLEIKSNPNYNNGNVILYFDINTFGDLTCDDKIKIFNNSCVANRICDIRFILEHFNDTSGENQFPGIICNTLSIALKRNSIELLQVIMEAAAKRKGLSTGYAFIKEFYTPILKEGIVEAVKKGYKDVLLLLTDLIYNNCINNTISYVYSFILEQCFKCKNIVLFDSIIDYLLLKPNNRPILDTISNAINQDIYSFNDSKWILAINRFTNINYGTALLGACRVPNNTDMIISILANIRIIYADVILEYAQREDGTESKEDQIMLSEVILTEELDTILDAALEWCIGNNQLENFKCILTFPFGATMKHLHVCLYNKILSIDNPDLIPFLQLFHTNQHMNYLIEMAIIEDNSSIFKYCTPRSISYITHTVIEKCYRKDSYNMILILYKYNSIAMMQFIKENTEYTMSMPEYIFRKALMKDSKLYSGLLLHFDCILNVIITTHSPNKKKKIITDHETVSDIKRGEKNIVDGEDCTLSFTNTEMKIYESEVLVSGPVYIKKYLKHKENLSRVCEDFINVKAINDHILLVSL
jgi:hypothetical protein